MSRIMCSEQEYVTVPANKYSGQDTRSQKHPPTQRKDAELSKTFTKSLTEAYAAAEGTDKTVLVLVFAHGMRLNKIS